MSSLPKDLMYWAFWSKDGRLYSYGSRNLEKLLEQLKLDHVQIRRDNVQILAGRKLNYEESESLRLN